MRPESLRSSVPAFALPLMASALASACSSGAEPVANAAAAPAAPKAPVSPTEAAEKLVRDRLGAAQPLRFAGAQVFNSGGATIVCGRVSAGADEQRYIAVGEQDLFVERQMEPGDMDRAAQDFCRNAS